MNNPINNITSEEDIAKLETFSQLSPQILTALNFLAKEPLEQLLFASSESYVTPFAIIAISSSPKQIDAMTTQYIKLLKEKNLFNMTIRVDGNGEREWCTIDLSNCFLHIITKQKLAKYELEKILKGDYSANSF
jgi:ribosomal silencing factor RsfS